MDVYERAVSFKVIGLPGGQILMPGSSVSFPFSAGASPELHRLEPKRNGVKAEPGEASQSQ